MADSLQHSQLSTILNALASIDRRLSRIEMALRVPGPYNSAAALPGPSSPPDNPASAVQAVQHRATGPSAQHVLQQQHHQQQQQAQTTGLLKSASDTNPMNSAPVNTTTFTPLEPPPQGYIISSRASMQEVLDQWTLPRGYSMRIAGVKVSGRRKVRWVCFRGGEARLNRDRADRGRANESELDRARAEGRRKPTTDRTSKKCGCMFKFELVETTKDSDVWFLHYPNDEYKVHNHGPSDTKSDPRARKLPSYMLAEVDQWLRDGWLVSKVQEELRARGFTNVLNTDLYNRRRLLKKEDAQGVPRPMLG